MKNPLNKRVLREIKGDFGKYSVIFLTLVLFIGMSSGFFIAAASLLYAYHESFTKYNVEDGHFETQDRLNKSQIRQIEKLDIRLYDISYVEEELENESVIRIFANRDEVNQASILDGRLPEKEGEIALDRMFADNNSFSIDDVIKSADKEYRIVGLVALSDYSTQFRENSDMMFDSMKFGVGVVDSSTFAEYDKVNITNNYAFKYNNPPEDDEEESELAEDLMLELNGMIGLEEFIPRYVNQAIQFTGTDFGSDRVVMQVLLYIIIVILAFIFTITINNTISKESDVIGTLRASGYTKNEIIWHYMIPPVVVTVIAALIGNAIGYSFMRTVIAGIYYNSYSLPTYVTRWNAEAFVETTLVPVAIMMVVTYLSLRSKLKFTPLQFLRCRCFTK